MIAVESLSTASYPMHPSVEFVVPREDERPPQRCGKSRRCNETEAMAKATPPRRPANHITT